jgi:hypothetical protein
MKKSLTKFLILTIILTAALSVNYLFAAWVGPTQAPPGGNTATPIHVGSTNQVKDGGLSLDALSVFGGGYFQGNVGVGVVTPKQKLDVDGGIEIGNTTNETAGTVRWTGSDLEVYNGSAWASLTGGEAAPSEDPDYADCINLGGSWVNAKEICYLLGSSCPSGWSPKESYSSTVSSSCNGSSGSQCRGGTTCSTGAHTRQNMGAETCSYTEADQVNSNEYCNDPGPSICTASQTEIGCVKN